MGDEIFYFSRPKNAQVWVETVIYTLIALSLMGLLLAFAKPKIDSLKDRMLIEQTIESMNKINEQINEVQIAPGNKRILDVKITKGRFVIDPISNNLSWELDSNYKYSELNQPVRLGSLYILTENGKPYTVSVSASYPVNLTLNNLEKGFVYESAPSPYTVIISSYASGNSMNVDITIN